MDAAVSSEFPPRALIRERRDSRGTRAKRIDFQLFYGLGSPERRESRLRRRDHFKNLSSEGN